MLNYKYMSMFDFSSLLNSLMLFTSTTEHGKLFQSLIILTNSEYL
jgi:hypothetical protein